MSSDLQLMFISAEFYIITFVTLACFAAGVFLVVMDIHGRREERATAAERQSEEEVERIAA